MTKDIEALLALPEEQLRRSMGEAGHGPLIVDLVLALRKHDGTVGERAANMIFADLVRRQEVVVPWSHPMAADVVRSWGKLVDAAVDAQVKTGVEAKLAAMNGAKP